VELVWPDDANPNNNLGQENVDVKKLNSPNATFDLALRNDAVFPRRLTLRADSYQIPGRAPCEEHPGTAARRGGRTERDPYFRHRPARHPLAAGWRVEYLQGETFALRAGEERTVQVKVTAPDGFTGRQAINVNAFADDDRLVGGVTLYAHD
jgi:hypothetical protein